MPQRKMADQLLEMIDGELRVCLEYGEHRALDMPVASWLTIYKRDAAVSLSLAGLEALMQLYAMGSRRGARFDDGCVSIEPNAYTANDCLTLRNLSDVWTSGTVPSRHRLLLTLAELRSLARMAPVLNAYDEMFSRGLVSLGPPGLRRSAAHTLTPEQTFRFSGDLHAAAITPGGECVLEPFGGVGCDFGEPRAEAKAWAEKARLGLTLADAVEVLAFDLSELNDGEMPRAGRVLHLVDGRSVGVFRSERYFPTAEEDEACALVPFTATEWRWFCACLGLYLNMASYLGL